MRAYLTFGRLLSSVLENLRPLHSTTLRSSFSLVSKFNRISIRVTVIASCLDCYEEKADRRYPSSCNRRLSARGKSDSLFIGGSDKIVRLNLPINRSFVRSSPVEFLLLMRQGKCSLSRIPITSPDTENKNISLARVRKKIACLSLDLDISIRNAS